jgi:ABC-type amino acid transport substrate-binding protein
MKLITAILLWLACAIAVPAAAQSGTLDKIRKSGVITMGYTDNAVPFSFKGDTGQPQGYSVDLCREIASGIRAQLGLANLETRWVELTIQNRLEAVRDGRVDIECSTTTWTLSRQKEVDFSLVTFVDGGSILTRVDFEGGRISDFGGKRIGVIAGTTTEKVLRQQLQTRSIKAEVVTVKARDAGLQLLEQRKVDGFASDRIDHEYRLAVNRVLAGLYRTGGIEKIYGQWLGRMGPPSLLLSAAFFIQGIAE